jgi:glycosyltransferase involved in cell wall biosynthesis
MKRRILVLNERDPRNPLTGGAETHVFEIFSRLVRRGHDVTLLAAGFSGGKSEEIVDGVRVKRYANRYLYYFLVPWIARREAARGADVVVDVLNKLPFLSPWLVPKPCMAIVHHLFGTTAFRQVSFPIAVVTWLMERLIPLAYARTPILAISPSTKNDLIERGIDGSHVHVIPPGVDKVTHVARDDGMNREPIVVWIGRLEPYKRADVAIDAMAEVLTRIPEATLVVVGAGGSRAALEAHAQSRGLDKHVRFTGFVSEEEKIDWIRKAAIVVQTSEKEGWGMTMIEASICNTVPIASDVEGLRDSVQHDRSGLLVPYGDAKALAAAIVRVLTDASLRARLVAGGLEWSQRFGWDEVADDTLSLVEETLSPGQRPLVLHAEFPADAGSR